MNWYKADLHIHTVLSPCGSLEMSPIRIVQAALHKGLDIIGITDHNSTRQCAVVAELGKKMGLTVFCGAEVTTKEEVHCLTFFEDFGKLNLFQAYLDAHLPDIKNKADVFGDQVWVNDREEIMGEEERLLINGINQSIESVEEMVHHLGGLFIPAHVDRQRYSVYSQLGFLPKDLKIDALEISGNTSVEDFAIKHPEISLYQIIRSSDGHYPDHIGARHTDLLMERPTFLELKMAILGLNGRKTSCNTAKG